MTRGIGHAGKCTTDIGIAYGGVCDYNELLKRLIKLLGLLN